MQIVKELRKKDISCVLTAPTYKAAKVISDALHLNEINESARTIHTFLGIKPFINYKTRVEKFAVYRNAKKLMLMC